MNESLLLQGQRSWAWGSRDLFSCLSTVLANLLQVSLGPPSASVGARGGPCALAPGGEDEGKQKPSRICVTELDSL